MKHAHQTLSDQTGTQGPDPASPFGLPAGSLSAASLSYAVPDFGAPRADAFGVDAFGVQNVALLVRPAASASSTMVTGGHGFKINLLWDAAAAAAPAAFRAGIEQAAQLIANTLTDKITVNISIDYSGTGGGADAGPDGGYYESYTLVRSDLTKDATPGITYFNSLPTTSSIQGQSNVAVWDAQLKLFGLLSPNSTTTDDGSASFATDISPSLLVGVAFHELTHALGRVPYGTAPDIFDLSRYTAAGTRLFSGSIPAPAAYFSVDGGTTKIADYGLNSDPSDFLNSGIQGSNDPLDEYYSGSTIQGATLVDLIQLEVLGFHVALSSFKASYSSTGLLANMGLLKDGVHFISTITLTDTTTPSFTLTGPQYRSDAAVLAKISSPYALSVTGASAALAATLQANAHVTAITVSDTAANVASALTALSADTKLTALTVQGTKGSDTLNLTGLAKPVTVNLGGDTAAVNSGLSAPALTFLGTPDSLTLGAGASTVDFSLLASSGIETIQNFSYGLDTLNIDLKGAASSKLSAIDTTVDGAHAIYLYSSADPTHGVVLEGLSSGLTAANLLSSHLTFVDGHAIIR
jgi:hypothetical protein